MYIGVVPDKFIWAVNWLHYLNYEPIARTLSTCHLVCTRKVLGQTVSSYGWCNIILHAVPLFWSFSIDSHLAVFLTELNRVFHVLILYLVRLGDGFASGHLSYRQASTYRPCHTYYVTVLVFLCPYVSTTLSSIEARSTTSEHFTLIILVLGT